MGLKIIGAGMAGLLAANMLKHHNPVVIEGQRDLPNNHSAVLRFSSTVVGDVLGIDFKKVNLTKRVLPWKNEVADTLAYSRKVLGLYSSSRSISNPKRTETVERYIAPPDLIRRMAENVKIEFGQHWDFKDRSEKVLSTIPMPILMKALGYHRHVDFKAMPGVNIRATIEDCDAYVSLVIPDPTFPFHRVSITGDEMIAETSMWPLHDEEDNIDKLACMAADVLGISPNHIQSPTIHRQLYAKIAPTDETERRNFIFWASSLKGYAFSLGRFACWRPGLLLDDLVKDIRLIDGWIKSKTPGYDMDLHHGRPS